MSNTNGRKGSAFEHSLLDITGHYWPDTVTLGKQGVVDKGDLHMPGNRLYIVEAKSSVSYKNLEQWWREACAEAVNKGVEYGVVVHKRKGKAQGADQWATMTYGAWLKLVHRG